MEIFLYNITRLYGKRDARTPTGIDRVDLRYLMHIKKNYPDQIQYVFTYGGQLFLLNKEVMDGLGVELDKRWNEGKEDIDQSLLETFFTEIDRVIQAKKPAGKDRISDSLSSALWEFLTQKRKHTIYYVNISHQGIDNILAYTDLYTGFSAKFIFYIYDLIPISFPEYVKDGDKQKHMKRIDTVLSLRSSLILTDSEYVKDEILRYAAESEKFKDFSPDRITPMIIGTEDQLMACRTQQLDTIESLKNKIYFVVIGTIEPRKNHLLLLNLWRELAEKMESDKVPKLIIIGKRGWENENIVDMLDRCDSLHDHVREMSNLGDTELFRILKGSRALLFPTFVEGWGLPMVEAMTLNVPVICSDISVLRESGQGLAEYVSPINGEAWEEIILDYAQSDSQRRAEQIARLKNFKIPQWDKHFKDFDHLLIGNE